MKKINSLFLSCLIVFSLFSCSGGDAPKSITEKFLSAVSSGDYEQARKYGTEDTDRLLDTMEGFKKMGADPGATDIKFEVVDEKITGESAVVTVKIEGHTKEQTFNLIREQGKWKVAMTKASINASDENIFNLGATSTDTTGVSK
ncbi:MAG: DUF4878 domain-containing protein [Bacteroidia bacterium]